MKKVYFGWLFAVVSGVCFGNVIGWQDLKPAPSPVLVKQIDTLDKGEKTQLRDAYYKADLKYRMSNSGLKLKSLSIEDKKYLGGVFDKKIEAIADAMVRYDRDEAGKLITPPAGRVKIKGYALPLDLGKGAKFSTFMLVPVVGACIHVPPPPANQMVLVHLEDKDGVELPLYAAVTVEGQLKAQGVKSKAKFIDGQGIIDSGYIMTGAKIRM